MNRAYRLIASCIILSWIFLGCSKELSYENNGIPIAVAATGTLKDDAGNCLPINLKGSYYNGIALLGDTNFLQVTLNVKTTGSYSIQTDRQNGFQFAGSGVFNNTGIQTINLKASGTPLQKQATNFTVTFNNTSCSFAVNVLDSTGHAGGGSTTDSSIALGKWQFVANGHTYTGNIVATIFTNLIGGQLDITGFVASGADTVFVLSVEFPASTLDTGTYPTSAPGTNFALQPAATSIIIFAANPTSTQIVNITISSYDPGTKIVSGTFSGIAYDFNGTNIPITNGKFKATVQ
jgi:hypothetical protein